MGREVTAIRSCDIVIIIGGRSGTLGEFSIAYDEGKLIGVLENTGGITQHMDVILKAVEKETGAKIFFDKDPENLVKRLVEEYRKEFYKHPNIFSE
jgi:predicted Rossmann-fold nucleotide-binding protein